MFSPRRPTSLWTAAVVLTIVIIAVFPVFAWLGYGRSAGTGVKAAAVAAAVCWAGGLLALLATGLVRFRGNSASGVLLGTACRTGLPIVVGLVLHRSGGSLAAAGVFAMILGYYLVALVAETLLAIRVTGGSRQHSEGTRTS